MPPPLLPKKPMPVFAAIVVFVMTNVPFAMPIPPPAVPAANRESLHREGPGGSNEMDPPLCGSALLSHNGSRSAIDNHEGIGEGCHETRAERRRHRSRKERL